MSRRLIILLCVVLAAAKGESVEYQRGDIPDYEITTDESIVDNKYTYVGHNEDKFDDRTENYITFNRLNYAQFLQKCETKLEILREYYEASVEGIQVEQSFVIDYAVQFEKKLYPLEFLSDVEKNCIHKHRSNSTSVSYTRNALNRCTVNVNTEIDKLLVELLQFKSTIDAYYNNNFDVDVSSCRHTAVNDAEAGFACVEKVVSDANDFRIKAHKNFEYLLDAARCAIKAYIKRVIDCNVSAQYTTTYSIAESTTLIDNCRKGKDDCKPCPGYEN